VNKYNAKKVVVTSDGTIFNVADIKKYNLVIEGIQFDSEMEGSYYVELLWMKRDGAITEIVCHPTYVLQDKPKITYIPDFLITFTEGQQVAVDVKGVETSTFSVKRRLFIKAFPDLELRVLTKYLGKWVPIKEVKREKAAKTRALNKMIKKATQKG
jgi:hypothetical protein